MGRSAPSWSPPTTSTGPALSQSAARLDGSGVERDFLPTSPSFHSCGIAVDSGHIYWGDAGGPAIRRAPLGRGKDPATIEKKVTFIRARQG